MKPLFKRPTFILQSNCSPLLTSFVDQISEEGEACTLTASEENLIKLEKATKFSEYTSGIVAFGDGEEFNHRMPKVTSLIFSSPDVILLKEHLGIYTEDEAEILYRNFVQGNKALPQTYQLFKSSKTRILVLDKIKKLGRICPSLYNFFEHAHETKNKKNKTIHCCNWV